MSEATEQQFIILKLNNEQYAIDIQHVNNIVRIQRITRVPKAQPYYLGVINLRGEVIPVMSLRLRFGMLLESEGSISSRIIIVKLEDNGPVGLLVDEVRELLNLSTDNIEKPNFKDDDIMNQYLSGVGKAGDSIISILNIANILSDKEAEGPKE